MRLLQNMGHSEAFFNRLRQIRSDESFRLTESGTNSLIQIVSNALGQKAQVIILQYPTDHAQSIKKVLLQFDNKISVIDTRLWLLENTTSTQLINLIDNDIDHVTKDAARILGEKLADFVLSSGE
ncbi:MAG: hypothetical protein JNJ49_03510 [Bdellovibrionaceae bacterium]|nr:hypothetical protein [Pseudobdellovibrionaceae bacterium]